MPMSFRDCPACNDKYYGRLDVDMRYGTHVPSKRYDLATTIRIGGGAEMSSIAMAHTTTAPKSATCLDVIVIGAGFSGMHALYSRNR